MTKNKKPNPIVKLIKKAKRLAPDENETSSVSDAPTTWSSAVRTWVKEFQSSQRTERLPAFESLFKDART